MRVCPVIAFVNVGLAWVRVANEIESAIIGVIFSESEDRCFGCSGKCSCKFKCRAFIACIEIAGLVVYDWVVVLITPFECLGGIESVKVVIVGCKVCDACVVSNRRCYHVPVAVACAKACDVLLYGCLNVVVFTDELCAIFKDKRRSQCEGHIIRYGKFLAAFYRDGSAFYHDGCDFHILVDFTITIDDDVVRCRRHGS